MNVTVGQCFLRFEKKSTVQDTIEIFTSTFRKVFEGVSETSSKIEAFMVWSLANRSMSRSKEDTFVGQS